MLPVGQSVESLQPFITQLKPSQFGGVERSAVAVGPDVGAAQPLTQARATASTPRAETAFWGLQERGRAVIDTGDPYVKVPDYRLNG